MRSEDFPFEVGDLVTAIESKGFYIHEGTTYKVTRHRESSDRKPIQIIYLNKLDGDPVRATGYYHTSFRLAEIVQPVRSKRDDAIDALVALINSKAQSPRRDELEAVLKEHGL